MSNQVIDDIMKMVIPILLEHYNKEEGDGEDEEDRIAPLFQQMNRVVKRNKCFSYPINLITDELLHATLDLAINPKYYRQQKQEKAASFLLKTLFKQTNFQIERIFTIEPDFHDLLIQRIKEEIGREQEPMRYIAYWIGILGAISGLNSGNFNKTLEAFDINEIKELSSCYEDAFALFLESIIRNEEADIDESILITIIEQSVSNGSHLLEELQGLVIPEEAIFRERAEINKLRTFVIKGINSCLIAIRKAMRKEEVFNHFDGLDFFKELINGALTEDRTCFEALFLTAKIVQYIKHQDYEIDFDCMMKVIDYTDLCISESISRCESSIYNLSSFLELSQFSERVIQAVNENSNAIIRAIESKEVTLMLAVARFMRNISAFSPQQELLCHPAVVEMIVSFFSDEEAAEISIDFFNNLYNFYSTHKFPDGFMDVLGENADIIGEYETSGETEEIRAKAAELLSKISQ